MDINLLMQAIQTGGNPQKLVMGMIENSLQQNPNPLMMNLYNLAKQGKTQEVEQIARNMFKEQGRDFDSEFNSFKKNMKL